MKERDTKHFKGIKSGGKSGGRQNQWYLLPVVLVILLIAAYALYGMITAGKKPEPWNISVVVNAGSQDRWNAFREGLNQGAEEFGATLNMVSTGYLDGIREEAAIVSREVSGGADGVIISPCAADPDGLIAESLKGTACILAESDLGTEDEVDLAAPDMEKAGAAVVRALSSELSVPLEGIRIGILSESSQPSASRCADGFVREAEAAGAQIAWSLSDGEVSGERISQKISEQEVDVLAALDDMSLETAAAALEKNGWACLLCGVGRSPGNFYYLDYGVIQAMVVPDEFYMGYECVRLLCERLNNHRSSQVYWEIPFITVTGENMFDPDAAEVLFPAQG